MISSFKGPHYFLHNDFPTNVELNRRVFPTVSHGLISLGLSMDGDYRKIIQCVTVSAARKLTAAAKKSHVDNAKRLEYLSLMLNYKFNHGELQRKLLDTGSEELRFENQGKDTFLGTYNGEGENHLGRALMKIRSEIMSSRRRNEN